MSKKSKIIGLDMDEVLAELMSACIKIHNGKIGNCDIVFDEVRSYNLDEHYPVSRQEVADFFYKPFSDIELEKCILPIQGAFEKLQELHKQGHTLYVITARHDRLREQTLRFLDTHYAGLIHDVHFANHFFEGSLEKHHICKKIGVEVMVEDNYDYAHGIACEGIVTYLIEKPWNIHRDTLHQNIKRVTSWQEIEI